MRVHVARALLGSSLLFAGVVACSGSPEGGLAAAASSKGDPADFTAEAEAADGAEVDSTEAAAPKTLARVVVERSESVDGTQSAQAMAHFVEWDRDAAHSLELVGLGGELPKALPPGGACRTDFSTAGAVAAVGGIAELELLDAGSVEIRLAKRDEGSGPASVTLAPHAFPSVSSLAAGLVYTTRDRSAEALPSDTRYEVVVDGARSVPHLVFSGDAPPALQGVTLGGVPLENVVAVDGSAPLDLTWEVGATQDVVSVEFSRPDDGQRTLSCTFADDAGAATISPQMLEAARGATRLSIHRMRSIVREPHAAGPGEEPRSYVQSELRFDFELNRLLTIGDRVEIVMPVEALAPAELPDVEDVAALP